MAMLAEPRRKQRIGPNPRGKFFQEDEDNRGRQMLMKMGWKTGDGLGTSCQGMSEPIKPKINTESRGLGFDKKTDPWVAHNEEFEQLLKSLNTNTDSVDGRSKTVSGDESSNSGNEGLEKKSKGSRSRIHYHKFVKNKDLSRASTKDISCIFGKTLDETAAVFSVLNSESLTESPVQEKDSDNVDMSTKETCEITEEEQPKKKKKKRSKETVDQSNETPVAEAEVNDQPVHVESIPEEELAITKKKKRKNKEIVDQSRESLLPEVDKTGQPEAIESVPEEASATKKKKKKRTKETVDQINDSTLAEEELNVPPEPTESIPEEELAIKKKKKKRSKDKTEECPELEIEQEQNSNQTVLTEDNLTSQETEVRRKKKKKKDKANELGSEENQLTNSELQNEPANDCSTLKQEGDEPEEEEVSKKKKSKKRKYKEDEEHNASISQQNNHEDQPDLCDAEQNESEDISSKKKKKKRRKQETENIEQVEEEPEQAKQPEDVAIANDSTKNETDKVEKFGCLQFINRGSIVDYFNAKMKSKGISVGTYV